MSIDSAPKVKEASYLDLVEDAGEKTVVETPEAQPIATVEVAPIPGESDEEKIKNVKEKLVDAPRSAVVEKREPTPEEQKFGKKIDSIEMGIAHEREALSTLEEREEKAKRNLLTNAGLGITAGTAAFLGSMVGYGSFGLSVGAATALAWGGIATGLGIPVAVFVAYKMLKGAVEKKKEKISKLEGAKYAAKEKLGGN